MKKLSTNLYFVRHGESCSNKNKNLFYPDNVNIIDKILRLINTINYEPTLSKHGIKQSKQLHKKLKNYNFDLIICSNMIRSIMTGIFTFNNQEIIICPHINEVQNFLGTYDKSNQSNKLNILIKKLDYLKAWLKIRNIEMPPINLDYYNNQTEPNTEKFIKILSKIIVDKGLSNKKELNICIISHGTFIRTNVNKYFHNEILERKLKNTEIIKFTL